MFMPENTGFPGKSNGWSRSAQQLRVLPPGRLFPQVLSTGEHENAGIARDGNKKRYNGKGCQTAVKNILYKIGPEIIGMDCRRQRDIDFTMIELDGTENKGKLGANAILAVSLACAKAGAEVSGLPLYRYLGGVNAKDLPGNHSPIF